METRQRESLCEKGDKIEGEDSETRPSYKGKPEGGQEMEGGGRRDGCEGANRRVPTKCEGVVAEDEGMVQSCGQQGSAARSSYARADHGGAG